MTLVPCARAGALQVGRYCWMGPAGKDAGPVAPYTKMGWAPRSSEKEGAGVTEEKAMEVRRTHMLSALFATGLYKHLDEKQDNLQRCELGGNLRKVLDLEICQLPYKENLFWGPQDKCLDYMPATLEDLRGGEGRRSSRVQAGPAGTCRRCEGAGLHARRCRAFECVPAWTGN